MKVHLLRPSNSWRQMWENSGPSSWLRRKVEVAAGGRCYCRVPCYCSCCLLWGGAYLPVCGGVSWSYTFDRTALRKQGGRVAGEEGELGKEVVL